MGTVPTVTDQRRIIADAVNAAALPGVTAYTQQPATVSAGDVWPVWQADEYPAGCLVTTTYAVFVALPGTDFATAIETMSELRAVLPDALEAGVPVSVVTRAEPAWLAVTPEQATVPGLRFTLTIG